mmetsp:Transcript_75611/g.87922  ORF Transcript_75611/g.87922 Transcript_75611/m.87922 type:complete len:233 (+) Transcript_75611:976-1674(+)
MCMSSEQLERLLPPLQGLMQTESSKFSTEQYRTVIFRPAMSMPSVLSGKMGRPPSVSFPKDRKSDCWSVTLTQTVTYCTVALMLSIRNTWYCGELRNVIRSRRKFVDAVVTSVCGRLSRPVKMTYHHQRYPFPSMCPEPVTVTWSECLNSKILSAAPLCELLGQRSKSPGNALITPSMRSVTLRMNHNSPNGRKEKVKLAGTTTSRSVSSTPPLLTAWMASKRALPLVYDAL